MYILGSIIYWFLGSAEVQSWSKFDVDASDTNVKEAGVPSELYEVDTESTESIK